MIHIKLPLSSGLYIRRAVQSARPGWYNLVVLSCCSAFYIWLLYDKYIYLIVLGGHSVDAVLGSSLPYASLSSIGFKPSACHHPPWPTLNHLPATPKLTHKFELLKITAAKLHVGITANFSDIEVLHSLTLCLLHSLEASLYEDAELFSQLFI